MVSNSFKESSKIEIKHFLSIHSAHSLPGQIRGYLPNVPRRQSRGCMKKTLAYTWVCVDLFRISKCYGKFAHHFLSRVRNSDGQQDIFWRDSFEQDRSWDVSGTTISGISGTHQNSVGVRMSVLIVVPQINSKLGPFC